MTQATYNYSTQSTDIPTPQQEQMSADHDLIQLCTHHIANCQALEACPLDPDESSHWAAYLSSNDAISHARPTSLAGLVAKARAAKREALQNGREDITNGSALVWGWHLVNDLIRLDEGAS